jgi:hypothetical protein
LEPTTAAGLFPTTLLADVAVPAGIDGFLGTRASFGMDVVLVGLLATLPLLAWSIYLVARRRNFAAHRKLQFFIAAALATAIVVFEIDVRLISDWKLRAAPSPFWPSGVLSALGIHLVFAISTLVLWVWVVWEAVKRFPSPPGRMPTPPVTGSWPGWPPSIWSSRRSPGRSSTGSRSSPADQAAGDRAARWLAGCG